MYTRRLTHRDNTGNSATQFIMLLLFFAIYTFTTGTAADILTEYNTTQFIKISAVFALIIIAIGRLISHPRGWSSLLFVFREMWLILLFLIVCALLLPFSFFFDISLKRLLITAIGVLCLQVILGYYVVHSSAGGGDILARHMLYVFCALSMFGLISLLVYTSADPREYPTAGLVHPNIMASVIAQGFLHAFQYKKITRSLHLTKMVSIARLVVIIAGIPIFLVLYSRGAAVALLISSLAFLVSFARRGKVFPILVCVWIFLLILILSLNFSDVIMLTIQRQGAMDDISNFSGRTVVWQAIFSEMQGLRILTGFGYAIAFPSYSFSFNFGELYGTHNAYLQALTSGGLVGFVLFTFYIVKQIYLSLGTLRAGIERYDTYFMSFSIFLAVNCFSESLFGTNLTAPFVIFMCSQICHSLLRRRTSQSEMRSSSGQRDPSDAGVIAGARHRRLLRQHRL